MQGRKDVEALRRRLYRPDASPQDVAAYAAVAEPGSGPAEEAPAPAAPRQRRRRAPLVLGAVALLVAGGVVANGVLQPSAPAERAAPAATPARTVLLDPDDGLPVRSEPVVDGGDRDGATGAAEPAGTVGVLYTLARGDTVSGVAGRFGICAGDVLIALPYGADAGDLPAGQQLTLVRARIGGSRDC